jgi:ribosomal protein S18 acetylase RimI-like enzyme
MLIKTLTEANAVQYWDLRLKGLREKPEAFGASYEEELNMPIDKLILRFKSDYIVPEEKKFVLGAFDDNNNLVGMVGFRRERRTKLMHKASLWGMYVDSKFRQNGIGRLLLVELLNKAKLLEDLGQVTLAVVSSNAEAKGLYASLGFQVYGVEKKALKVGDKYFDEDLMAFFVD